MMDLQESTGRQGVPLPKLSMPQVLASLLNMLVPSLARAAQEAATESLLQGWAAPQVLQPGTAASAALLLAWSSEARCCCCCCCASGGRAPLAAGDAACRPGPDSLLLTPAPSPALLLLLLTLLPKAPELVLSAAMLLPLSAGEPACRTRSTSPRTDQRLADVTRTSATLPISPSTGSSSTCRHPHPGIMRVQNDASGLKGRRPSFLSCALPDNAGLLDHTA